MPNCNAILDTHAGYCEGRRGELRLRLTASPYHRTQCFACLRLHYAIDPLVFSWGLCHKLQGLPVRVALCEMLCFAILDISVHCKI